MQAALPDDIMVSFELDQSPYVRDSLQGVGIEAGIGAALTGLMVLLFLRDWRSLIVVVLNIPLALTASLVALWLSGQSINLMTLGGLALAVGILVDESTVEVENIHTQMGRTRSVALAVRRGNADTAVPRLLAMLCILAVFIPSFVMQGSARALFVPLSLAVGFAMIGSYLLSSTFVPVVSVWLLRHVGEQHDPGQSVFARLVQPAIWLTTKTRWLLVPAYLGAAGALLFLAWETIGTDIFPQVDSGQFQFRLKAPPGTRIEQTEDIVKEALNVITDEAGADNVDITVGYIGVVPSAYPINSVYLWTGGPDEAVVRVALKPGRTHVERLKARLRDRLNAHLPQWLEQKWLSEGVPPTRAAAARQVRLSYEPADIVNEVMSFGSPTPVEIQVSGTKMADNRAYAEKLRQELAKVPAIKDLQYVQTFDYPTVDVTVNREKAAAANVQAGEVGAALAPATSSSRFTLPNYWRDPASGVSYQVQVEVPQALMKSPSDVAAVPVRPNGGTPILVQDVADVKEGSMPGQVDRYNQRRLVSLTGNIQGTDLGRVATEVAKAIEAAGPPPKGVKVDVRGQVTPMRELFDNLENGLLASVAVILLLLTAYFQSIRLALTAVAAVPAVLCGVAASLLLTGTTLNLQSFMGSIMAVGVAIANAILFVTFAERARLAGGAATEAAVTGVRARVRPILMTSAAMVAGMIPMAVGSDQSAPLARAVIGGLVAATAATLILLPAVFALLMGGAGRASQSLDPFDPASSHHVPGEASA
jgi:multidrug efflux pump subunit AcrB